jgi:hypothetical protein
LLHGLPTLQLLQLRLLQLLLETVLLRLLEALKPSHARLTQRRTKPAARLQQAQTSLENAVVDGGVLASIAGRCAEEFKDAAHKVHPS